MMLPRGVIGVLHLRAMPGDPKNSGESFDEVLDAARRDADAYIAGGVGALVIENFGSAPFNKGTAGHRIPAHHAATITVLAAELVSREICVGINCLRNDAYTALGIAAATGAHFIRVNVHTGASITDQGLIEGEAAQTLRYRQALRTHVQIAADVLVKHAQPLAPLSATQATEETLNRGMADAVIVSGVGTGKPVDMAQLREVRKAAGERPVWIGSGMNPVLAQEMRSLVNASIVGSWVKQDGVLAAPVDADRVRRIVDAFAG